MVGGRRAKEEIFKHGACNSLRATEQITVLITAAPDNLYDMTACLDSPGLPSNANLVNEMVSSVTFKK